MIKVHIDLNTILPEELKGQTICFDAKSLETFIKTSGIPQPPNQETRVGNWVYKWEKCSRNNLLPLFAEPYWFGSCVFDKPCEIPMLLDKHGSVWMSLTPTEILTCRTGIETAEGQVLIGGLGMGWQALEISRKPNVQKIIVVEQDADIIQFFGTALIQHSSVPVTIVKGDFYTKARALLNQIDTVVVDIWLSNGECREDPKWLKLKSVLEAKGINHWAWGEHDCLRDLESVRMGDLTKMALLGDLLNSQPRRVG